MDKKAAGFSIKNHISYNGWKYVVLVITAIFGWSLAFSVTEYQSPPELTVSVYLMSMYMPTEETDNLVTQMWPYVPDMEKVEFISPPVAAEDDFNFQQYLMVMLGAGQGDIFIVNRNTMEGIAAQEGIKPLDEYIESGALDTKGIDLSSGRMKPFARDENNSIIRDAEGFPHADESAQELQYALPLGELYGFMTQNYYDSRELYAILMAYSQNHDNAVKMMQGFIDEKLEPRPDWLDDYEKQEREAAGEES